MWVSLATTTGVGMMASGTRSTAGMWSRHWRGFIVYALCVTRTDFHWYSFVPGILRCPLCRYRQERMARVQRENLQLLRAFAGRLRRMRRRHGQCGGRVSESGN